MWPNPQFPKSPVNVKKSLIENFIFYAKLFSYYRADIYSCGGFNAYNQQMAAAIINNPNFMSLFESLKEFYAVYIN